MLGKIRLAAGIIVFVSLTALEAALEASRSREAPMVGAAAKKPARK